MRILFRSILLVSILVLSACNMPTGLPLTAAGANTGGSNPAAASPTMPPATQAPATQAPASVASASPTPTQPYQPSSNDLTLAKQYIKHIVIIMQENRSFDEYFGTYPGATGIPMQNGVPTVCAPDPKTGQCIKPYYNPNDINSGGPHGAASAATDMNNGLMNGFVAHIPRSAEGMQEPGYARLRGGNHPGRDGLA